MAAIPDEYLETFDFDRDGLHNRPQMYYPGTGGVRSPRHATLGGQVMPTRIMLLVILCVAAVGDAAMGQRRIYWVDNSTLSSTVLRSARLDGTDVFNIAGVGQRDLRDVVFNPFDNMLYWSDTLLIARIGPDTGGGVRLIDTDHPDCGSPMGIALDLEDGWVYWVDGGDGNIKRMGIDVPAGETPQNRSDVETVVAGFVGIGLFSGIDIPATNVIPAVGDFGLGFTTAALLAAGVWIIQKRSAIAG